MTLHFVDANLGEPPVTASFLSSVCVVDCVLEKFSSLVMQNQLSKSDTQSRLIQNQTQDKSLTVAIQHPSKRRRIDNQ